MVHDGHANGRRTLSLVDRETREGQAADQLRFFIDRIERLVESRTEIARELDSLYHEAWNRGFNVRILRRVVLLRQRAGRERNEAAGTPPVASDDPAGLTARYRARYGNP
jgi:uncharacterized protein (UPF0335 family)